MDTERSLLDLPTELVENVLSHLLIVAYPGTHTLSTIDALLDNLRIPILQVCKSLRQQTLCLIARTYIWIRIIFNQPHESKTTHWLTERFSGLSDLCTKLLPPRLTCITFELGQAIQPARVTSTTEVNRCSLVFPYQFDTFAQVCTNIVAEWDQLLPVSVTCPLFSPELRGTTNAVIVPILFSTFRSLQAPPENFNYWSPNQASSITSSGRSIKAFFEDIHFALSEFRRLKEAGYKEEADLYLLYQGKILCKLANNYIQPPTIWLTNSYNPGDPDWWMSETNIYRNAVISLLHHIECLACLKYADLHRRHGANWVLTHCELLTDNGTRWVEEPHWQWFGLSDHEMAEIYHARGLILKVGAEVLHECRTRWHYGDLESAIRKEREAAREMYFAKRLHPENELYQRLFEEYAGCSAESSDPGRQYLCWTINYVDIIGQPRQWVGDWRVLVSWGGPSILSFLPMAQKGFDDVYEGPNE